MAFRESPQNVGDFEDFMPEDPPYSHNAYTFNDLALKISTVLQRNGYPGNGPFQVSIYRAYGPFDLEELKKLTPEDFDLEEMKLTFIRNINRNSISTFKFFPDKQKDFFVPVKD